MYKLVNTYDEELIYNAIWSKAWMEKGFDLEFAKEVLDRCLIYNESKVPVATVEIKPYARNEGGLNEIAPFSSHPLLSEGSGQTAEVDKVAILKEHRGKNLDRLLATLIMYAEAHHIQYYVTLLEPVLFRALKVTFHVPMSRVEERVFYKGGDVIPAIIHAGEVCENKESYSWFTKVISSPLQPDQTPVLIHT